MTGQTYAPTLTEGTRELVKFDRITISAVIANDGGATCYRLWYLLGTCR